MESTQNAPPPIHPKVPPFSLIKVLMAAFILTGFVMYSYKYLPNREVTLVPSGNVISNYVDNSGTQFQWLDQNLRKFRCNYDKLTAVGGYCGLDVRVGDGLSDGVDFSVFDKITVRINYAGNAKVMRLYVRDFDSNFSVVNNPTSIKYMNTLVPVNELKDTLIINFSELTIPEWWTVSSGIPREQAYAEFTNVVHVGIDIPFPAPGGDHDLELVSIQLTGIYLSKDTWYLAIFGIWAFILLLFAIKRDMDIRKEFNLNSEDLAKEKVKSLRLKKVSEKYKELAILDTLTGVFNRRGIYQFYENCFDNRQDVTGAIIMLDIDHFKRINDTYGHDIGDKVINTIGKILLSSLREQDSVGRWGGEEFIVLCIDTDMDGATFLAEKIRSSVENHAFADVPGLTITVSLGVGPINSQKRFEDNVKHTDAALYKAKEAGRNCWIETDDPF